MKNLLSENMLRFGTKNLSDSAKRKLVFESIMQTIKEHGLHNAVRRSLLTEQTEVDLLRTQPKEAAAALKSFRSQLAQKIYSPTYLFANKQYYLATTIPYTDINISFSGKVVAFQNHILYLKRAGEGGINLPLICNYNIGMGGDWSSRGSAFEKMTWVNTPAILIGPAARVANDINGAMNAISIKTIQELYNAHPNKARFDKSIAEFKANTGNHATTIKAALSGNAKTFFGV